MYRYYNAEPHGDNLPDCVIRAIKTALDIPYDQVVEMLYHNGQFNECDAICIDCYSKLLTHDIGLPHYIGGGVRVVDVANDFENNILLIRMNGHLTCSIFGVIHDTWDCSLERCTDFWIAE